MPFKDYVVNLPPLVNRPPLEPDSLSRYLAARPGKPGVNRPAPGAVTALPSPLPGPGSPTSEWGYLYEEVQGQSDAGPGVVTSGTASWSITMPVSINPTVAGNTIGLAFSQNQSVHSGIMGLFLDRSAGEDHPHGIQLTLGGVPMWDIGMDFDSSVTPSPDLILAYAHQLTTPGDVLRISQKTEANGGVKYNLGGEAIGSPAASGSTLTVYGPTGASTPVGGIESNIDGTGNSFKLTQRAAASKFTSIAYGANMVQAYDYAVANADNWRLVDVATAHTTPTSAEKNRLYVNFPNTHLGSVGLNTNSPQGLLDIRGYQDPGADPVVGVNRYLVAGYADTGIRNRSMTMSQTVNAGGVHNFLTMIGDLGTQTAIATPLITTTFRSGKGIWADLENNVAYLFSSSNGADKTPTKCVAWGDNSDVAKVGFLGTPPVAQQATASAAGITNIRTDSVANAVTDIKVILTALRALPVAFGLAANTA